MNSPSDSAGRTIWQLIDTLCDQFEQSVVDGKHPQIVDYLSQAKSEQEQALLLQELILLDLELKTKMGLSSEGDRERYLAQLPDQTEVIEKAFHHFETVQRSRDSNSLLTSETTSQSTAHLIGKYFGDYRLEKEIARGGMGVVYQAQQLPLNRPVALKMILSSHLASDEEIQRFQLEAEAAAKLDHPGIVPVYEVGEFEGQHYFSMGLVEGGSLEELVQNQSLTNKAAAQLIKTIAEAVQYAHSRNIVHRDLKPGNVLIDKDGQPKVTDFGLAKNIENDVGMTSTGAIMGTPGYMAPEQAAGKVDEIGPLADVYALGGILYFLLTDQPPFGGKSAIETIQQVLANEPSSPRQQNPAVDADLATICLKCLEKEPARRYASAGELVEELKLYLEDRPISARPVGRIERSWRWCKRNPLGAAVVGLLTILAVAGPIVAVYQMEINRRLDIALTNERAALQRKDQALQETEAAIKKYVETVKEAELLQEPRFKDLLKLLLKDALAHYQRFAEEHRDDQDIEARRRLAEALGEIGNISSWQGSKQDAIQAYLQALSIYEQLREEYPTRLKYQHDVALVQKYLGNLYRETGEKTKALLRYQSVISITERLTSDAPEIGEYQSDLANSYKDLAAFYVEKGMLKDARETYQQALSIEKPLVRQHPDVTEYQTSLATTYRNLAQLDQKRGEVEDALAVYQQAILIWERMSQEHPEVPEYQHGLADCYSALSVLYWDTAKSGKAATMREQALSIWKQLAGDYPTVTEYQQGLANAYCDLAETHRNFGNAEKAIPMFQQALSVRKQLVREYPQIPDYRHSLAETYRLIALQHGTGNFKEAHDAFEQAQLLWEPLVQNYPTVVKYQESLAKNCKNIGYIMSWEGRMDESASMYQKALVMWEELVRDNPTVTSYQQHLADVCYMNGYHHANNKKEDEAVPLYERALSINEKLRFQSPDSNRFDNYDAFSLHLSEDLIPIYHNLGEPSKALAAFQRASELRQKLSSNKTLTSEELQKIEISYPSPPWEKTSYQGKKDNLGLSQQITKSGKFAAMIVALKEKPDDAKCMQSVKVNSNQWYHLSGWVKTNNVQLQEGSFRVGANLSVLGRNRQTRGNGKRGYCYTRPMLGTNDWTYLTLVFHSGEDEEITVAARLGIEGGTVRGTAWFDDLCLIPIEKPDDPNDEKYQQPEFLTDERRVRNLLENADFEEVPIPEPVEHWLCPTSWRMSTWRGKHENLGIARQHTKSGEVSAQFRATIDAPDALYFWQSVVVDKNQWYHLSGWIRTQNIQQQQPVKIGASLSILEFQKHTSPLLGTNDWTYVAIVFNSQDREALRVAAWLGEPYGIVSGVAWHDDLCLIPIDKPDDPEDAVLQQPEFLTTERRAQNLLKNADFEILPKIEQ